MPSTANCTRFHGKHVVDRSANARNTDYLVRYSLFTRRSLQTAWLCGSYYCNSNSSDLSTAQRGPSTHALIRKIVQRNQMRCLHCTSAVNSASDMLRCAKLTGRGANCCAKIPRGNRVMVLSKQRRIRDADGIFGSKSLMVGQLGVLHTGDYVSKTPCCCCDGRRIICQSTSCTRNCDFDA
jgi:hypothetical protein